MAEPTTATIRIEFVDADPAQPDPATRGQAARDAVEALRAVGYDVRPAYTGAMGGEIYELVRALAEGAAANKDVVLALITNVAAPVAGALAERLKKSAAAGQPSPPPPAPPVTIVVAGAQVEVRDPQISPDELLRQLLEADPALPQRVNAQSEIAIRMPVPAQAQRPRR